MPEELDPIRSGREKAEDPGRFMKINAMPGPFLKIVNTRGAM